MSPLFTKKQDGPRKKYVPIPQIIIPYTGNDPELKLIFERVWKMCDKCSLVYPENYIMCIRCSNKELREFHVHNNMAELEKNFK